MRTLSIILLFALAFSFVLSIGCKGAQRADNKLVGFNTKDWVKIGERRVKLQAEKDVIPVTIGKGLYKRIMLVVHKSALEIYDIKVTFGNGESFSPKTRLIFAEDTRSRQIDLPGFKRIIKMVEFKYKSRNVLTGWGEVELWGKK